MKVMGSSKRAWMEGEMDGAGEVNGERGDVVHHPPLFLKAKPGLCL
jgi:hypothetical protein